MRYRLQQLGKLPLVLVIPLLTLVACGTAAPAPDSGEPAQPPVQVDTGDPAPTPVPGEVDPPQASQPAVSMMRVTRETTTWETNDPALSGRADLTFLLPMYEGLMQFDGNAELQPMLAESWEANEDFTVWTFNLRRGVQFHGGWGDVTAKDVVHTMDQERRMDHGDARGAQWRALIDRVEAPDGPDGYEVVFYLTTPEPILLDYVGTNYTSVIRSARHWEEGGGVLSNFEPNEAGVLLMQNDPVGSGPYQFQQRAEAQYIRYEPPEFEHWRITPDFPELQIFFTPESSTRLAMLTTGEVYAADLPRDLQRAAIAQGAEVITGTTPAIRLVGFFGGNYVPSRPEYDSTAPMTNPLVREAMNRAINRDELNEAFLGGRAELMMQTHSHERFTGWNPEWPEIFQDYYGYDPERGLELLAEAGYPNGFSITQAAYPRPGLPEMMDISELVADYWRAIGINVDFQPIEVATITARRDSYQTVNTAWLHTGSFTEPTRAILVYHYDGSGTFHGFDDDFFTEKFEALEVAGTPEERHQLTQEMGDYCFQTYCTIPLFWIPYEITIDPTVISQWETPGVFSMRDYEAIKATR